MNVITEVLYDLYLFAVKYRFGFVSEEEEITTPALWSPIQPPAIVPEHTFSHHASDTSSIKPSPENTGYVCVSGTFVYVLPTKVFDGIVTELSYKTPFAIVGSQGKWLQIEYGDIRGWVYRDDTTRNKKELDPHFFEGERYTHDHRETVKLRTVINDMFHAVFFDIPLQDVEYIGYKLQSQNRRVAWPLERPRVAGTWQRILKGVPNVHLGIKPKTDAVMEYINADNTGHVAYVEAVYPDESIFISEVGFPEEGRYHERTMTKDEWIELRPVFIEVV